MENILCLQMQELHHLKATQVHVLHETVPYLGQEVHHLAYKLEAGCRQLR